MAAEGVIEAAHFRRLLMQWYRAEARVLPWRGSPDPYRIWLSEVMLQQTRVAAVIEHYHEFLRRFPTLMALSLASDADVVAAWSGLGYYRRARMLHKAAQFIVRESDGRLPTTVKELLTLPGIGEYTAAAIASIAFGEPVAVVDGNVERVILRLTGRADEGTAGARAFVRTEAQALMPGVPRVEEETVQKPRGAKRWTAEERIALAAAAHPNEAAGGADAAGTRAGENAAGDHNQAMMELGAMICLPRSPLCNACPVYEMCRTRGEHPTQARAAQKSVQAAYLLDLRKQGMGTEVLLNLRRADESIMPAMFELPPLPVESVEGREPVLRVRHSITNTNYYVQVFTTQQSVPDPGAERRRGRKPVLRRRVPKGSGELHWVNVQRLSGMPITGLARKVLQRLKVMDTVRMNVLE